MLVVLWFEVREEGRKEGIGRKERIAFLSFFLPRREKYNNTPPKEKKVERVDTSTNQLKFMLRTTQGRYLCALCL